jgi:hypothetical protein
MAQTYKVGDTSYQFPDEYTDQKVQSILSKQGIIKSAAPEVPGLKGMPLPGVPKAPLAPGLKPDTGLMNFYNKPALGKSPDLKTQADLNKFEQANPIELEPGQEETARGVSQILSGKDEGATGRSPTDVRLGGASHVLRGAGKSIAPIALPLALGAAPAATLTGLASGAASGYLGERGARALGAPEGVSSAIGDVAGVGGGLAGTKIPGLMPNAARAGANFQKVMGAAGDQPVATGPAGDIALRAHEISSHGATLPKIFRDFLRETTTPGKPPLTYEPARDFASNAGRLSAQESLNANPVMKRQVALFSKALDEANAAAAENAGQGPLYKNAMREYRNAKRIEDVKDTLKDIATSKAAKYGAAAGIGGYATKKILGK